MKLRNVITAAAFFCAISASSAKAQLYGPQYPPPNGVTLGSAGVIDQSGGLTWTYSNFAFSAYKDLYYAVLAGSPPLLSLDGTNRALSFDPASFNPAGGVAVWRGSTTWCYGLTNTIYTLPTMMVLTVTNGASPLPLTSSAGIPGFPAVGAVLVVSGGGITGYQANYLMSVQSPFDSTWQPALDFYNNNHSCQSAGGLVISSLSSGFWNTDYALTANSRSLRSREGQPFSLVVADFVTMNPTPLVSNFTATINWGDGNNSPGTLVTNGSGGFDVVGNHAYLKYGFWTPQVLISSVGGSTVTANDTARRWPKPTSN